MANIDLDDDWDEYLRKKADKSKAKVESHPKPEKSKPIQPKSNKP